MVSSLWTFAVALLSVPTSFAQRADGRPHANAFRRPSVPVITADDLHPTHVSGAALPPLNTTYLFDQLIDHQNPSLGTFKQRFWMSWEFFESGGPIVLFTPGEANAAPYTGYLTNKTINGQIAQQEHGAAIVLEHRYYGESNPFPDLKDESLRFHTIQQAVDDLEFFAKTANLPMPGGDAVKPDQVPWVLVGGSYSGALTGWTMVAKPNLFRAGYASSAVVEAITDFWGYFEPIRQGMPQNCSADVQAVISHIDRVLTRGSKPEIESIKANFGLQNLTHLDDVAGALRNNLWDWQSLSPSTGPNGTFFEVCDALEVKDGKTAPASGFGLDHALTAWGNFWKQGYLKNLCGKDTIEDCLGTYNATATFFTDTTIDNAGRSWTWIVCNEVGFYQEGAPQNHPTLVTRLVQPAYDERQCTYYFPQKFKQPPQPSVSAVNRAYDGWNLNIDRLFFANGRRDPWREATVSAESSPYRASNARPVGFSDGFHCSDLSTANANVDGTVATVQKQGLAAIKTWLAGFEPASGKKGGKRVRWLAERNA